MNSLSKYMVLIMAGMLLAGCASSKKTAGAAEKPPSQTTAARAQSAPSGTQAAGTAAANAPAPAPRREVTFRDVKQKIWKLSEIRIGAGSTVIDRKKMEDAGMGDVYIIQFTDEGVNGKAAPNRYFAPYDMQEAKNVSVRTIVGTLMAATINVGGLMENEYYYYLQRISRWELSGSTLELFSAISPDEYAILCYHE
jgi:heat shock protein HslJ